MFRRSSRRDILGYSLATAGLVIVPASIGFAALQKPTPEQPLGPFYPFKKPAEQASDLARVAGASSMAHGRLLNLSGRVLNEEGRPVVGAEVEIWHTNGYGRYHNVDDRRDVALDPGFQGFGRSKTDSGGGYAFRTVRPQPYPASWMWTRPAHIHFLVNAPGFKRMITQMYFAGDPNLTGDHLLNSVRDPDERQRLIVSPTGSSNSDADSASWDIVLKSAS